MPKEEIQPKILIADDDIITIRLLSSFLQIIKDNIGEKFSQFEIIAAENGKEALTKYNENPHDIHIIISDINMGSGGQNGDEFFDIIKEKFTGRFLFNSSENKLNLRPDISSRFITKGKNTLDSIIQLLTKEPQKPERNSDFVNSVIAACETYQQQIRKPNNTIKPDDSTKQLQENAELIATIS